MSDPGFDTLVFGDCPLLIATPHTGSRLTDELRSHAGWLPVEGRVADPAGTLLHHAARRCGASLISARYHPCVIDFMMPPHGRPLSVDVGRGGLCRTRTTRGESLYDEDRPLTQTQVDARVSTLWRPFHRAILAEIDRLRARHTHILLLVSHASGWLSPYSVDPSDRDCHIGTDNGHACAQRLIDALTHDMKRQHRSWVVNGNTDRIVTSMPYGDPARGIHVLDLEIAGRWRADCAAQQDIADHSLVDNESILTLLLALEHALRGMTAIAAAGAHIPLQ